jgi:hypothetical protein
VGGAKFGKTKEWKATLSGNGGFRRVRMLGETKLREVVRSWLGLFERDASSGERVEWEPRYRFGGLRYLAWEMKWVLECGGHERSGGGSSLRLARKVKRSFGLSSLRLLSPRLV